MSEFHILVVIGIAAILCSFTAIAVNLSVLKKFSSLSAMSRKAVVDADGSSALDETEETMAVVAAAAIAAMTGIPLSGFRVVSMTPADGFTTPAWGHSDRMAGERYLRVPA